MISRRIAIFAALGVAFYPMYRASAASDPDLLLRLDSDRDGTVSLDEGKKAADVCSINSIVTTTALSPEVSCAAD